MLEATGFLPEALRSDRGTETPMMANAHWQMHLALNPNVSFTDVYWYGTSTLNQRIESWWRHMSKSQTSIWKRILDGMNNIGEFNGSVYDQIALLYIFLPIIRRQIYHFVDLWNIHTIRKQKNRLYLPTGKPVVLYHCPPEGVRVYGKPLHAATLKMLQNDVKDYGMHWLFTLNEILN